MRYVYTGLLGIVLAAVLLFAVQNLGSVTVQFLTYSARLPLSLLILLMYLLGMASGGAVLSLMRAWIGHARARSR